MRNDNIATKYELKALEKMRAQPAPTYDYTPDGIEMAGINYNMQRKLNSRIDYLQTRLGTASRNLRRDFDRSC